MWCLKLCSTIVCCILFFFGSASATIFFTQSGDILRVDLLAQEPIVYYTYFEPDARTFVLDMLGVRFSHEMDGAPSEEFIQSISGETVREDPLTHRVVIQLGQAVWDSIETKGGSLALFFRRSNAAVRVQDNKGSAHGDDLVYRIGPADLISIEVLVAGADEMKKDQYRVPESGAISYPLLGDIAVQGKTTAELKRVLEEKLQHGFLVNPKVNVRIDEYRSKWVNVIGEVQQNGRIYLGERTYRLIDVLSEAGGLTENAGSRLIVNRAQGDPAEQVAIPLSKLFSGGRARLNVVVQHGDVINVLSKEYFYIRGEVKRAGRYPVEDGISLLQAISLAGGLTQWAARKDIRLLRNTQGEKEQLHVNLKKLEGGKSDRIELQNGDVIIVPRRSLL